MANRTFYRTTIRNAVWIFRVLKKADEENEGPLTLGEVARRSGLHPWTVSRTLDLRLGQMVDIQSPEELQAIGLHVKLVSLKDTALTEVRLLRYLAMKTRL